MDNVAPTMAPSLKCDLRDIDQLPYDFGKQAWSLVFERGLAGVILAVLPSSQLGTKEA
jgi:hypothetical protein